MRCDALAELQASAAAAQRRRLQRRAVVLPRRNSSLNLVLPDQVIPLSLLHPLHRTPSRLPTHSKLVIFMIQVICAVAAVLGFFLFHWRAKSRVRVHCGPSATAQHLARRIASAANSYTPPLLLCNAHIHTIYASLFRGPPQVTYEREIVITPDGGALSLDWLLQSLPRPAPVLLLLHGLTGGSHEPYMRSLASTAQRSFRVVCLNMRGAASSPLLTARAFSAEVNADVLCAVEAVASACPGTPIVACGFSLGANILFRFLGDPSSQNCPIKAAVSICNPLDLQSTSNHLAASRLGRLWSRIMAKNLIRFWSKHAVPSHPDDAASPLAVAYPDFLQRSSRVSSVYGFDNEFVCPMFGHENPEAYYAHASSHRCIGAIRCPVLFISADDDPITGGGGVGAGAVAGTKHGVSVMAEAGGHCAFLKGWAGRGGSWGDDVALQFLEAAVEL
jgi:predicted alpha/beta-fold hydrolase